MTGTGKLNCPTQPPAQVITPAFVIADVLWLLGGKHGKFAWFLALIQLGIKVATVLYSFQWLKETSGAGWRIVNPLRGG